MKKNMGNVDKVVRILIAIIFFALYFGHVVTGTFGLGLTILGGVFVLTSILGFCTLYLPFGISSCKKK